jgi:GDP-L-fucose synthase
MRIGFVTGHRGIVGSALVRRLEAEGFSNVVTRDRVKLYLKDQSAVATFAVERVLAEMI